MALLLPHRTLLRRAAMTAALGALLAPAAAGASAAPSAAAAKAKRVKAKPSPSVKRIAPMKLSVGETLEIHGRNFLRGRGRNTVVFQREGAKAIFVKAEIGTTKLLKVTVPERLEQFLLVKDGVPVATRFRLRILSARFGKRFTKDSGSPTIFPAAVPAPPASDEPVPADAIGPDGEVIPGAPATPAPADDPCAMSAPGADFDGDLLDKATEQSLGLDPCKADSDKDTITDGYEYRSARDLNDDEYQDPNQYLPFPGKRPYPNPLDGQDAGIDFDGDVLTLSEEFGLWKTFGNPAAGLDALSYSDGMQCTISTRGSDGRRRPALVAATYDKHAEFLTWAARAPSPDGGDGGYLRVYHPGGSYDQHPAGLYDLRDFNHDGIVRSAYDADYHVTELRYFDFDGDGFLCDNERDEDADGLTNYDESHGRVTPPFWAGVYAMEKVFSIAYVGTSMIDPDSDGDGVRDAADDQDHDDIPNLAELSRKLATGDDSGSGWNPRTWTDPRTPPNPADPTQPQGRVNPFNPCLPNTRSRTCLRHPPLGATAPAPFDDSPNYYVFN